MAALNPPARSSIISSSPDIKPLPLGPAVLFFAVPSLAVTIAYYWGIPAMVKLVHGRPIWLVHFVLWTLFHVFIYWQWLYIMTVTLPVSYVAYRQRNTWTGIIIHGLHNAADMSLLILIILGILV